MPEGKRQTYKRMRRALHRSGIANFPDAIFTFPSERQSYEITVEFALFVESLRPLPIEAQFWHVSPSGLYTRLSGDLSSWRKILLTHAVQHQCVLMGNGPYPLPGPEAASYTMSRCQVSVGDFLAHALLGHCRSLKVGDGHFLRFKWLRIWHLAMLVEPTRHLTELGLR